MLSMLTWFRVNASGIAVTALLSFWGTGGAFGVLHEAGCHDDCAGIVAHDASAHHVRTAATSGDQHPLHCLVCHWARSFRPHTEGRILSAPAVQPGISVHVEYFTASSHAPAAQPPLRSPPASPAVA
jgi:hypothetical protein